MTRLTASELLRVMIPNNYGFMISTNSLLVILNI